MKKIKLFTIAALMLGFVSCQKEEKGTITEGTKPAPTKKEMLVAKTWSMTGMKISPEYNGKTDLFPLIDDCQKDNTWKFSDNTSDILTIDEGSNMCKGTTRYTSVSWGLNEQDSTISIDSYDYELKSVTSDEFQMVELWTDGGVEYTITSTYSGN